MILLATSFQDALWLILLVYFLIMVYVWTKGKTANKTLSVVMTILLAYLVFYRFPSMVWIIAIVLVIYWIYGSNIKNAFRIEKYK